MGTQTLVMRDILGLTPGLDPRNSDKSFVLNCENVVFDSLGPKSDFASRYLTTFPLENPKYIQGCRLKLRARDRVFIFGSRAIVEWDEDAGGWQYIYVTPDTTIQPYRWTYGYLNGYMYFCHPTTGMLKLNLDSNICEKMYEAGVPTQALSMCVSNGRIAVIDEEFFTWSGPSNGLDWTPKLGGAGFQRINDRVSGLATMVMPYQKGCLTFTTGGVMRSEFAGDATVWHHRNLNTEYRPINSFCLFMLDDNTVGIVDERGIFQTAGEKPSPLTPLFNEFLILYLQRYQLKQEQNVRIEWDDLKKRIYLSVSLSQYDPLYEKAFVLYPSLDKWGSFDKPHFGIVPVLIQDNSATRDYFGYVDPAGRVNYWLESGAVQIMPLETKLDAVYPLIQKPATFEVGETGTVLSSSLTMNTVPVSNYNQIAGLYAYDADTPYTPLLAPLLASIQIGLLTLGDQAEHDRMVEVQGVYVGSAVSGIEDPESEDYTLVPAGVDDEDYIELTGGEDFGIEGADYVNHGLRLLGTVDGKSIFDEAVPDLVRFDRTSRNYSCHVTGLWHILELTAMNVGESFHIRHARFTVADGGRLL